MQRINITNILVQKWVSYVLEAVSICLTFFYISVTKGNKRTGTVTLCLFFLVHEVAQQVEARHYKPEVAGSIPDSVTGRHPLTYS